MTIASVDENGCSVLLGILVRKMPNGLFSSILLGPWLKQKLIKCTAKITTTLNSMAERGASETHSEGKIIVAPSSATKSFSESGGFDAHHRIEFSPATLSHGYTRLTEDCRGYSCTNHKILSQTASGFKTHYDYPRNQLFKLHNLSRSLWIVQGIRDCKNNIWGNLGSEKRGEERRKYRVSKVCCRLHSFLHPQQVLAPLLGYSEKIKGGREETKSGERKMKKLSASTGWSDR